MFIAIQQVVAKVSSVLMVRSRNVVRSEVFPEARADGDPRDMACPRVVGAMPFPGPAMVGRQDDQCRIQQSLFLEFRQDLPDARIRFFDG